MEKVVAKKIEKIRQKHKVAIASFFVAFILTGFKAFVGIVTGSLGILSEALHSGMDLVAAGITAIAVKISDKPADEKHNFGHGKIENISALFETLILIITCGWIIYESIQRLQKSEFEFTVSFWSFFVIIFSIIVDYNRAKILYQTAKAHKSQALEADALHFSSDILSSLVVLTGLIFSAFRIHIADTIAALIVSGFVLTVSFKLSWRAIDELIDRAPKKTKEKIESIISTISEIESVHDIRVRGSGPNIFIELNIHLNPNLSLEEAHRISHLVETKIKQDIENSIVHIHQEPSTEH
ncbi:MAG: cation diffusion facilitator family transporter [Candidatus Kapaibacteriales bacterium]